ncbi:MAG: uracil-DNA glycosylase [bacterium]
MKKREALAELNERNHQVNTCSLKSLATQAVFGAGSPTAEVVFIGEAPGKTEDKLGIPFMGSAGRFLDEMLSEIKLSRSDVYITNVVKYRPPNNRDPLPEEKDACRAWLIEELELVQPKLIVFLGRHALRSFFPDLKIGEAHGKLVHAHVDGLHTEYFLPLYHPASALYNGALRETLKKDFVQILNALKKIERGEGRD